MALGRGDAGGSGAQCRGSWGSRPSRADVCTAVEGTAVVTRGRLSILALLRNLAGTRALGPAAALHSCAWATVCYARWRGRDGGLAHGPGKGNRVEGARPFIDAAACLGVLAKDSGGGGTKSSSHDRGQGSLRVLGGLGLVGLAERVRS